MKPQVMWAVVDGKGILASNVLVKMESQAKANAQILNMGDGRYKFKPIKVRVTELEATHDSTT